MPSFCVTYEYLRDAARLSESMKHAGGVAASGAMGEFHCHLLDPEPGIEGRKSHGHFDSESAGKGKQHRKRRPGDGTLARERFPKGAAARPQEPVSFPRLRGSARHNAPAAKARAVVSSMEPSSITTTPTTSGTDSNAVTVSKTVAPSLQAGTRAIARLIQTRQTGTVRGCPSR